MRLTPLIIVCLASTLSAQQAVQTPEFEAVSVKLWDGSPHGPPGNSDGGPGTRHPEIYGANGNLRKYIGRAWGVIDYEKQVSGPPWIDGQQFAVDAKVPPGTTKEQFQKMLQKMLADRFGLVVHHETVTLPVFNLTIAKNGPKLQPSGSAPVGEIVSNGNDKDGFPVLRGPGMVTNYGRTSRLRAGQQTMEDLSRWLSGQNGTGRNIIDKTGLTDKYDFTLQYDFEIPGAPTNELGLSLFDASSSNWVSS
jgi:uncharacterized protein (TIGR03435 family)